MSVASDKGREFEVSLARKFRQIGVKAYRNKRSGAGDTWKADVDMPGRPFHIEAKSHNRNNLDAWWQQTISAAGYKTPVLMIDKGGYNDLAILRVRDFLNMVKTIQDDSETITELRS